MTVPGERETPRQRIERLVAEGKKSRQAVERAEQVWRERLQQAISIPGGQNALVLLDDLYHIIIDDRLLRRPERIEHLIRGAFEIHATRHGRRRVLGAWREEGRRIVGFAIIDEDGRVRSMHVIDERDLRKYQREQMLWPL